MFEDSLRYLNNIQRKLSAPTDSSLLIRETCYILKLCSGWRIPCINSRWYGHMWTHDKSVIVSCEDDRGIYWETPTENQFIHDGHPLPLLYRQGLVDVGLIVIVLAHAVYIFENALSNWQWTYLLIMHSQLMILVMIQLLTFNQCCFKRYSYIACLPVLHGFVWFSLIIYRILYCPVRYTELIRGDTERDIGVAIVVNIWMVHYLPWFLI